MYGNEKTLDDILFEDTVNNFSNFVYEDIDPDKGGIGESNEKKKTEDMRQKDLKELTKADESAFAACALMDFATPDEIGELAESYSEMEDVSEIFGIAMEKTIVKMSRQDRLKHLTKQAVFTEARRAKDPRFKKLMSLWKMERAIEADLTRIYKARAQRRAFQQIKNYGSNGIKKVPRAPINNQNQVGKKSVSGKIAQRAVAKSKNMFSNSNKASVGTATKRR